MGERDKEELARIGVWHNGSWKGEGSSRWRMTDQAIQMMDQELLSQINSLVGENDTLWHLGDFAMPDRKYNYYYKCREYRDKIKCRNVNIIWGNHDDRKIRDLFNDAYTLYELNVDHQMIVLCHYAMAVFNKSHRGALHLYGHSHSEAEPWLDRMMTGRRSMDVGVDNAAKILGAYRPFSLEEILQRLGSRPGFAFDHHVGKMANTPTEEDLNKGA